MSHHCLVYVTIDSEKNAKDLASQLLKQKLIACANIFPSGTSIYSWEGRIEEGCENIMILKTQGQLFESLCQKIKELHPYDCPCILKLDISSGHPNFLEWISQQTQK